ncbi:cytochrome P450 [Algoriphagus sp. NG3]|uniref:cytochrome P450 n=1 Tax=Algoriphagus sp. NG3 TaxID=3097546 RepID=UPI002A82F534|nr:cytochrome P450 [Algoriphagus sp. NG3]WPR73358.1 cytochrome P450 [Algoriphagus sp. NG3]
MKKSDLPDPFTEVRIKTGFHTIEDQNDPVTMLLRHKDIRKTAHNYKTFTSEAVPGRIVVPSEVNIRDTRQLPFEVDPPKHGAYRSLVESWFKRPLQAEYQEALRGMISTCINYALLRDATEVVNEFALPLQSRALTLLLNTPFAESETWISWGTHVFRSEGEALDGDKANILYDYIDRELDRAIANPSDDLYSVLIQSDFEGRKLSKEEAKGVLVLTFAGGRDTVINAVTNALAYFADHPQSLDRIRKEPELINNAVEEMIRYFSPLTHMGRVVTEDTQVCEHAAKADNRVSLCWASANRDEAVFENADEIVLDRKINPHVGFGFSHHNCLGATHARQIMRILLMELSAKVQSIDILDLQENIEHWGDFQRKVGYHKINVKFNPINQ